MALLATAAAGIAVAAGPAQAAGPRRSGTSATAVSHRASISPLPGVAPRTSAQAASAAATCAKYATMAGWANNGYYSGDLVTATAICMEESAGNAKLYVCDNSSGDIIGHGNFTADPVPCPAGTVSYDRGLWQLNSVNDSSVTDSCAFTAACNADNAYQASQYGTSFVPWSSYDEDTYGHEIDAAQAAVDKLTSGTVASAELSYCLVQAKSAVNARVMLSDCQGQKASQWTVTGGHLRSGSVCAAIGSSGANPLVVLRRCGRSATQTWTVYGRDELRNGADGKCLTDPNSSLVQGTQVDVAGCRNAKNQTWWLP
jgi:hypothetical protein